MRTTGKIEVVDESLFVASSWKLIWRKFIRHRLAIGAGAVLIICYVVAIFCEFFSTTDIYQRNNGHIFAPPTRMRIFDQGRLRTPFVYGYDVTLDPSTLDWVFTLDKSKVYPIRFFTTGFQYKLFGLVKTRIHLMGVDPPGVVFFFGADNLGRDLYSRMLFAARISLSIGLVGIAISFVLGCLIGGISGYFAGPVDMIIQRIIEFLGGIPTLPLWIVLSAALPVTWSVVQVYFGITMILSIVGWTGLARTVRSKILQLRGEDYVLAAKLSGATEMRIINRHLLPGMASYLIVNVTLRIPGMILGETALSFIGLGLHPPAVSWGVLLQDALNVRTVALSPWLMIPALAVVVVVLAFNFLGDGLRDAADPYKQ
jgi:peptide/nickel transport system permease protein